MIGKNQSGFFGALCHMGIEPTSPRRIDVDDVVVDEKDCLGGAFQCLDHVVKRFHIGLHLPHFMGQEMQFEQAVNRLIAGLGPVNIIGIRKPIPLRLR